MPAHSTSVSRLQNTLGPDTLGSVITSGGVTQSDRGGDILMGKEVFLGAAAYELDQ
jgi:hypothetical protein